MARLLGWSALGVVLLLLYAPLVAVSVYSFNASRYGMGWTGFTTAWYTRLAHDPALLSATAHSLVLALLSTGIATPLGTALALSLERAAWPRRWRLAWDLLVWLPVVTPDVLFAVCLVVAALIWNSVVTAWLPYAGVQPGWLEMTTGHVLFEISFVAMVVMARLRSIPPDQEEAARDLYASERVFLLRILLPQLLPAIICAMILSVTLSLDDFMVSFFTASPTSTTLPLVVYASARRGLSPEITALSTLMLAISAVLVIILGTLMRRSEADTGSQNRLGVPP